MTVIKTYRDLIVWNRSMELAKAVYVATRQMPADERFGLSMQMRRAAVSIPSNIAEGYARQSTRDYLRYLRNARGSLAELSTQAQLAKEMQMLAASTRITQLSVETDRLLQGLIRSIERVLRA